MDFKNFDRRECTFLTMMAKTGRVLGVQHLLTINGRKGTLPNLLRTTDRQGYTAVHYAALLGHLDILQLLLQHTDAECVNMESHDRSTALLLACQAFYDVTLKAGVVQSLLAAGADPNLPQLDPFARPLLTVLEKKWWQGASLLLNAGACAVHSDFEHDLLPPIYLAMDSLEIVEVMASSGCMAKTQWGNHDLLEWLLDVTHGNPIDNVGYSAQHVIALVDIIIRHDKQAVTLFSLNKAAKYGHLGAMQRMLQSLTHLPYPAFGAALLALDLAQPIVPPETVKSFLREVVLCVIEKDHPVTDGSASHSNMMLLLMLCHKDYLEFLLQESADAGFPVSQWKGNMTVGELLPEALSAQSNFASVRYHFNIRRLLLGPPLNPIPVLIGYSIDGDETLYVVKRLLQEEVSVQPKAFVALLYRKDIHPKKFFQHSLWPVQCFNALMEAFIAQGGSLRSPVIVHACIRLMRHPASLFLMLREGVPPEPFLEATEEYSGIVTVPPSSPEEARLFMLSIFVCGRFVDRLPNLKVLPAIEDFAASPAVRTLLNRFRNERARVSTLQQLCRVAVRRCVGGPHVQSWVLQLGSMLTRPAMDALLYKDEHLDDLCDFSERYHQLDNLE